MKTKQKHDCVDALKIVLETIGIPEIVYHDDEEGFSSTEFVTLIDIITPICTPLESLKVKISVW